jgi:hypothetical protein
MVSQPSPLSAPARRSSMNKASYRVQSKPGGGLPRCAGSCSVTSMSATTLASMRRSAAMLSRESLMMMTRMTVLR